MENSIDKVFLYPRSESGMPETEVMRQDELLYDIVDGEPTENSINIHNVTSIKAEPSDITILLGQKIILKPVIEPSIGNIPELVWETSDPKVLLIDPIKNGLIEGLSLGNATITATNSLNSSQTCTWSITVSPSLNSLSPKETETIVNLIQEGGKVEVTESLKNVSGQITIAKDAIVNFNNNLVHVQGGKYGDSLQIKKANVTISNLKIGDSDNAKEDSACILISNQASVILDNVQAISKIGFPVYVNSDGTVVTIISGRYTTENENAAVYVQKKGHVEILNGEFKSKTYSVDNKNYCLNIKNNLLEDGTDPREFIIVKGGTFYNFNPAESWGEPSTGNFVNLIADGYISEEISDNVWKVRKI